MSSAASNTFSSEMGRILDELRVIITDLQNQVTAKEQQIQQLTKELEKERNERALDKESIKALKGEVTETPEDASKGLEEARNKAIERMINAHNRMKLWSRESATETSEERAADEAGEGLDLEEARNKAMERMTEAHNRMKMWSGELTAGRNDK
ncbi:hypothetical protein K440DRAFT_644140 [Wilcoxina mikolae CBS 423.85]|nr:hypothetical protein K440DRAFT_644140 [Wilcoxina mikolae CBS 423.85]